MCVCERGREGGERGGPRGGGAPLPPARCPKQRRVDPLPSPPLCLPSVYLLTEIVALARGSPDGSATVLDYVCGRLKAGRPSPVALRKTLKLAAAVCADGPSDFKAGLAKRSHLIR